MKANYHTHTTRCGHACGTDESYVLAALSQGYDELGFSDHVPWPYRTSFTSPHVRMHIRQLDGYLESIEGLKKKYAGQISILTGFECEYFPDYIGWLADMAEEKRLDYLILGNHYDQTDETGIYFGAARTPAEIRAYVDSTVKGVQTGLFAYLAHPDLFMHRYGRFDENCAAAARDLCQACKQAGIPMEYNMHMWRVYGSAERAGYPCEAFFDIALSEGAQVIVGLDAHDPQELSDPSGYEQALRMTERFRGLRVDRIEGGRFGR